MTMLQKPRTTGKKSLKKEVPFGWLRDNNLGSMLGAFGIPLGSLGAANRGKKGFSKKVQKMAWNEGGCLMQALQLMPRGIPINNHFSSPRSSRGRLDCCLFNRRPQPLHFVLRTSGTVADTYPYILGGRASRVPWVLALTYLAAGPPQSLECSPLCTRQLGF